MAANSERFCLSRFHIFLHQRSHSIYTDARIGKKITSFCFVAKGSVTFQTTFKKVHAGAGDLIYMPEGIRYVSTWKGDPEIEFYGIDFSFHKVYNDQFDRQFDLQKIDVLCGSDMFNTIETMYAKFIEEPYGILLAMGDFFSLLHKAIPYLDTISPQEIHPVVHAAIVFIEKHYNEDFSIGDLAKHCNISESRLYRLFKELMGCSPVTFRNRIKIQHAITYLKVEQLTVNEISDRLNFHSPVYFRKVFKHMTGSNPTDYKRLHSRLEREKSTPSSDSALTNKPQ